MAFAIFLQVNHFRALKPQLHVHSFNDFHYLANAKYLTFLCGSYRSLYLLSSLSLLRLCDVLFLVTAFIIAIASPVQLEKSYLMGCYKTHIFQNAYIFSSKLVCGIIWGLNLTHHQCVLSEYHLRFLISFDFILSAYSGIGLILAGRIKGHMKTRLVPKMNALCVTSFSIRNRILDYGYISLKASLGLVGVKVGTII